MLTYTMQQKRAAPDGGQDNSLCVVRWSMTLQDAWRGVKVDQPRADCLAVLARQCWEVVQLSSPVSASHWQPTCPRLQISAWLTATCACLGCVSSSACVARGECTHPRGAGARLAEGVQPIHCQPGADQVTDCNPMSLKFAQIVDLWSGELNAMVVLHSMSVLLYGSPCPNRLAHRESTALGFDNGICHVGRCGWHHSQKTCVHHHGGSCKPFLLCT